MTFINTCADVDDLGGGRFRHTQHIKPVAYDDNGTLRAIASAFTASGKADRPHAVRAARLMTSVADDGMRRIHPTREEDRYVEIGTPYVKVGGVWRKMGFRRGMRTVNRLTWMSPQANMSIVHAGHYVKLEIELKRGYVPEDGLVAFPVGLNGLKRSGANILSDGRTVMSLRAPQMYDAANEMDTRAIDAKFVSLAGQPYYLMTLPSLAGMSRPVIDPTLALQPDGAAGKDTMIISGLVGHNAGINSVLGMGFRRSLSWRYRGLIQFDLSTIPAGATVSSATLSIYLASEGSSNATTLSAYRMIRAWAEGTKVYTNVEADGATWNTYDGSNAWGTAGASNTTTDREATDSGTLALSATEAVNEFKSLSLTASEVQEWVAGTFTNNGLLLKTGEENSSFYSFYSSDYGTAAQRPRFVVEYTTGGGGMGPIWQGIGVIGSSIVGYSSIVGRVS